MATKTGNPSVPSRPETQVAAPNSAVAATTVSARLRKPPVAASRADPTMRPAEKAISTVAASPVVPPKRSSVMSGKSAETGEKTMVKANPHHMRANRPRYPCSSR